MNISNSFKNFFMFYLPILIWMGFIFYLSGIPNLKTGSSVPVELIFRKTAHFLEYAVLSFLFARIFVKLYELNLRKALFFSFLGAVIFSFSDEFHQLFVVGRSGNFFDVGVDLVGIVFGLIIFRYYEILFVSKKR